jgi:signal transduction histidine kinase/ActR/RegA family two-component response regulator
MLNEKLKLLLGIGSNHHRSDELVFLSYMSFVVLILGIDLFFTFDRLQTQSHLWVLVGTGIIYIAYLSSVSYRICAHGLVLLNYGHIIFNALITGGVHSPAVACLTFMPTAALMLGRRSAYFWLAISLLSISGLALCNQLIPSIQHYHMLSEHTPWSMLIQTSMSLGLFATIGVLSLINEQQLSELQNKSKELAQTHQALTSAQAHKDEFIAAVGHELRTPMNAILGFTDILANEARSAKAQQTIQHIRISATQLLKVVSNILDYSQLMAGKLHLTLKQDQPQALIQDTIASIRYQYQNQPIDIVFRTTPQAPTTCLLDAFRIRQVLEHLLSNAVKFMEQGRIEVVLGGNDQMLRVQVTDAGIGISEEKKKSIFKQFEHATREVNRRYGGTGLGLAICEKLIDLHHGHIGVESSLGFGSTFWFEIPIHPSKRQHYTNELPHTIQMQAKLPARSLAIGSSLRHIYLQLINSLSQSITNTTEHPSDSRAQANLQQIIVTCFPAPLYYWFASGTSLSVVFSIYPFFFLISFGLIFIKFNYRVTVHMILAFALILIITVNLYLGGSHGLMNWASVLSLPAFSFLGELTGVGWLVLSIFSQFVMMLLTSWHQLPYDAELAAQPISLFWLGNIHMTILSWLIPFHYKMAASDVRKDIRRKHVILEQTQSDLLHEQKIKDEFISSVSHEFRTPMNAIMGFNYLLKEQIKDEPKALELQAHVTQSADHLLTVIDDIFDVSELQHGHLNIRKEPFNIQQIFQNAYGMFLSKTRKLDYKLKLNALPRWVIGDSHRLMQLLVNLIGNALKFTHKGHVHIHAQPKQGGIEFTVSDSGVGIEHDKLDLIFSQYGQVNHDRAKLGHGLGLAICKRLIHQQNGTIHVESKPNSGSLFSVWLPYPICPRPIEIQPNHTLTNTMTQALKILIVDDHPLNRILARQIFERTWSEVVIDEAEDGAKAIQKLRHHDFSIVIMDMVMPEMDGIEATTLIRTSMPENKCHIPILGLTANINPVDKERCLQAGMNDIIYKPFNKDELIGCIERLLNSSVPHALMV